ncbi:hypothetical protein DFH27DRAFT_616743 [Peziza echinospora]|nr:hypothetical protein DFH27DRAFT_616743 [Peziza echinospora]
MAQPFLLKSLPSSLPVPFHLPLPVFLGLARRVQLIMLVVVHLRLLLPPLLPLLTLLALLLAATVPVLAPGPLMVPLLPPRLDLPYPSSRGYPQPLWATSTPDLPPHAVEPKSLPGVLLLWVRRRPSLDDVPLLPSFPFLVV